MSSVALIYFSTLTTDKRSVVVKIGGAAGIRASQLSGRQRTRDAWYFLSAGSLSTPTEF
jgi:hypothetical protein